MLDRIILENRELSNPAKFFNDLTKPIRKILEKALEDKELTEQECTKLFDASPKDSKGIYKLAQYFQKEANGSQVSFVVNRNINFTNICYMGCKFCGFAKRVEDKGAEWLSIEQIVQRAKEAQARGATEVCIQGGLHPKLSGNFYREIIIGIKKELPNIHIHAFSPFEIWYGASKTKTSYEEFLLDLKECGLGSIPGTAAEILDVDIRNQLTKNKLSTEKWIEIIKTAHLVGIPSSATIMYGHIDKTHHWAAHICKIRDIQKETGGFTELVPLSFIYSDSPLYLSDPKNVRKGPNLNEIKKMHSVSRIILNGLINNIQVSWPKLGPKLAKEILQIGANDLGGTLMNESISRAAGGKNGQEITAKELSSIIKAAGKTPTQRNTLYQVLEIFDKHEPIDLEPLVPRGKDNPISFLEMIQKEKL